MNRVRKSRNKILMPIALLISLFAFSINASAIHVETVPVAWDHIIQLDLLANVSQYDTNYEYQDLRFFNGYTYTESHKDTTSIMDLLGDLQRIHYSRTYSTY